MQPANVFHIQGRGRGGDTNQKHIFLRMILYCASNYMALSRNWSLLRHVLIPPAPVVQFPASISSGGQSLRAGKWSPSAVVRRVLALQRIF